MRVAQLNACGACSTFRAPSVVAAGVTEDVYDHLDEYRTYGGYAERFVTDHRAIDDELFTRLRGEFTDAEVLDLTLCLAVYLGLGRSLEVLGIEESSPLDV